MVEEKDVKSGDSVGMETPKTEAMEVDKTEENKNLANDVDLSKAVKSEPTSSGDGNAEASTKSCDDDSKKGIIIKEEDKIMMGSSNKDLSRSTPDHAKSPASSAGCVDGKMEVDDDDEDNIENAPGVHKKKGHKAAVAHPGRKRKSRPRDLNAPKAPINGYVRFLNDNRERCRKDNPDIPFANITKILAQEWSSLKQEEKQKYLDAAEKDRERYTKDLEEYQQTESYKQFRKHLQDEEAAKEKAEFEAKEALNAKKMKHTEKVKINTAPNTLKPLNKPSNHEEPPVVPTLHHYNIRHNADDTFDIPIFTEEFLDHNKAREAELRQLRKANTDLEEQNAVLTKHIDSFKDSIQKLEQETEQHRNSNKQLENYIAKLRSRLVESFQCVSLPGFTDKLSVENVDSFMEKVYEIMQSSGKENDKLITNIKSIVAKLECSDL